MLISLSLVLVSPMPPLLMPRLYMGMLDASETLSIVLLIVPAFAILVSLSSPVVETSTVSPGFRKLRESWPKPTPAGVPVAKTSPG